MKLSARKLDCQMPARPALTLKFSELRATSTLTHFRAAHVLLVLDPLGSFRAA